MAILVAQFVHGVLDHRPKLVPIRWRGVLVEEFVHGVGLLFAGFASLFRSIRPLPHQSGCGVKPAH
jgi:hypothetical protein